MLEDGEDDKVELLEGGDEDELLKDNDKVELLESGDEDELLKDNDQVELLEGGEPLGVWGRAIAGWWGRSSLKPGLLRPSPGSSCYL